MGKRIRAAVVGASGFGRYHAQWYAVEGAELVGYVGTTDASVAAAEGAIEALTHQSPKGYNNVDRMLEAERPEVVSICTPPDRHLYPAIASLRAGAHVLCEKPIIFESGRSSSDLLARADEMVRAAEECDRLLAVNLQYAAAVEPYLRLYERSRGEIGEPGSYEFMMESKGNRHGPIVGERIWTDLGPHALTPILVAFADCVVDIPSIRVRTTSLEVVVDIEFVSPSGRRIHACLRTGSCRADAVPVRRFGFNGFLVDVVGHRDPAGGMKMELRPLDGSAAEPVDDFMQTGIRRFLSAARGEGALMVTGPMARRNMEVLLQVLEKADFA